MVGERRGIKLRQTNYNWDVDDESLRIDLQFTHISNFFGSVSAHQSVRSITHQVRLTRYQPPAPLCIRVPSSNPLCHIPTYLPPKGDSNPLLNRPLPRALRHTCIILIWRPLSYNYSFIVPLLVRFSKTLVLIIHKRLYC